MKQNWQAYSLPFLFYHTISCHTVVFVIKNDYRSGKTIRLKFNGKPY